MDVLLLDIMKCIVLFIMLIFFLLYNRFIVSLIGIYWYYLYYGVMRREGLNGVFIVFLWIKKEVSEGRL